MNVEFVCTRQTFTSSSLKTDSKLLETLLNKCEKSLEKSCFKTKLNYIQLSAKVYIHLSRRNTTKVVVIMNHYNTTTFT